MLALVFVSGTAEMGLCLSPVLSSYSYVGFYWGVFIAEHLLPNAWRIAPKPNLDWASLPEPQPLLIVQTRARSAG